jgi:hypothetical protein
MSGAPVPPPIPITKPKTLAVEGDDDKRFFDKFISSLKIVDIQIIKMMGKYPLSEKVKGVTKISGWNQVVSFGLAIDADSSHTGALQSIQHSLQGVHLAVPQRPLLSAGQNPKVTFFILPGVNRNGALEDLCLSSVGTDPAMTCVDAFFQCLGQTGVRCRKISKAKVHAFLASRCEPDKRLGEATEAGYWPIASQVFDDIRCFLLML